MVKKVGKVFFYSPFTLQNILLLPHKLHHPGRGGLSQNVKQDDKGGPKCNDVIYEQPLGCCYKYLHVILIS